MSFDCHCYQFGFPHGQHRRRCIYATEEDRTRQAAEDEARMAKYQQRVVADLQREAQRPDKAVPRRNMRW